MSYTVAALYQFARFDDPEAFRTPIADLCAAEGVRGTVLLAGEGINGTIAGPDSGIETVIAHLRELPGCDALEWKRSETKDMPFRRMKVRLKREIVTLGQPNANPREQVGTYVAPAEWNDLIARDDVAVIDTRNAYETAIGTFAGAIDPNTDNFRDFPAWWRANQDRFEGKQIAMFCTGGIRCEKATSWLIGEGVDNVHHLKGGILKYLEEIPKSQSRWQGDCYVFDDRVSVGHGLRRGNHVQCGACGRPLAPEDFKSPHWQKGVSCAACIAEYSEADRKRFADRQRQIELAMARGENHFGPQRSQKA